VKVRLLGVLASTSFLFAASHARADRELLDPLGGRGSLVFDQISGFRVSSVGGINFAGPFGVSFQRLDLGGFAGAPSTVYKFTNVWFSPSADYFLLDHFSIGGIIELTNTSTTVDFTDNTNTRRSRDLPGLTNLAFIPRIGALIAVTDRFGIWPRLGFGYGSRQFNEDDTTNNTSVRNSINFTLIEGDIGVLYRFNETLFVRVSPEFTASLGGSRSRPRGNTGQTDDAKAALWQISLVTGFGAILSL
jgi:hypothetical protein